MERKGEDGGMLMGDMYTWQAWPSIRYRRLCTLPVSGCKPMMVDRHQGHEMFLAASSPCSLVTGGVSLRDLVDSFINSSGLVISSAYCLTYGRRNIESPGTCGTSSLSADCDGMSEKMFGAERTFRKG